MTTKFCVFNPETGSYTDTSTEQERDELLAQIAWNFFLHHTHNLPYSVVTTNEDGTESWTSPSGESIKSPAQVQAEIDAWRASIENQA